MHVKRSAGALARVFLRASYELAAEAAALLENDLTRYSILLTDIVARGL